MIPGRRKRHDVGGGRLKADDVLDAIGSQIVTGRLAPGQQLPTEPDLCRSLGISRPSLREGLKSLAGKGLVESRRRRGTMVLGKDRWDVFDSDVLRWMAAAPPDPHLLVDLLELRTFVEPAAARFAAQRASSSEIREIERAYDEMAAALPHDVEGCCRHDLAFHERIIAAAGNVWLSRLATTIRAALLAAFRISANARKSYEDSLVEHLAVAVAIRKRAPAEAERAMRHLLAGTARDLGPAISARARPLPEARNGGSPRPAHRIAAKYFTKALDDDQHRRKQ